MATEEQETYYNPPTELGNIYYGEEEQKARKAREHSEKLLDALRIAAALDGCQQDSDDAFDYEDSMTSSSKKRRRQVSYKKDPVTRKTKPRKRKHSTKKKEASPEENH